MKIHNRPYDPPPEGFAARFVQSGWRGIEHYYGARTSINKRWFRELGADRLTALRKRYRNGDKLALVEAQEIRGENVR